MSRSPRAPRTNGAAGTIPEKAPRHLEEKTEEVDDDSDDKSDDARYRKVTSVVNPANKRSAKSWFTFWYGFNPSQRKFTVIWKKPVYVRKALKDKKPTAISFKTWRKQLPNWKFTIKDSDLDIVEGFCVPLWSVTSNGSIRPNKLRIDLYAATKTTNFISQTEFSHHYKLGITYWTRISFTGITEWSDIQPPFVFDEKRNTSDQKVPERILKPMTADQADEIFAAVQSGKWKV